jgi:hypothetical protein
VLLSEIRRHRAGSPALRAPDDAAREAEMQKFVDDVRKVADVLRDEQG